MLAASPHGQQLQIDILSTWGDPYYVGLSSLEVFDDNGVPVELDNPQMQVRADPADINVLPEYGHDEVACRGLTAPRTTVAALSPVLRSRSLGQPLCRTLSWTLSLALSGTIDLTFSRSLSLTLSCTLSSAL